MAIPNQSTQPQRDYRGNHTTREIMTFLDANPREDVYFSKDGLTPIPMGTSLIYEGGKARPNRL